DTRNFEQLVIRAAPLRPLVCIMGLTALAACSHAPAPAPPMPVPQHASAPPAPPPPAYTGPTTAQLVFLGTTDVHGRILPYDYYNGQTIGYGLARLKPLIDSVRAA